MEDEDKEEDKDEEEDNEEDLFIGLFVTCGLNTNVCWPEQLDGFNCPVLKFSSLDF